MIWFPLALGTATLTALQDFCSKKSLRYLDATVVTALLGSLSALGLGLVLTQWGWPQELKPGFWGVLLADGGLNTFAFWAYNRALKEGELSLVAPIAAFSPLFFFITSPLIVGESPTATDFLGCLLVVVGSYGLNWQERHKGYWAPLRALWQYPASRRMLGTALIWSITANLDKVGVQKSSPLFWMFAVYGFVALGMGILITCQGRWPAVWQQLKPQRDQPSPWVYLLPMGLFSGVAVAMQMYALTLTLVVRVIAVKRLSTLMGVLLGVLFLGEKGLGSRLGGAALMVAGVAVLLG